MAHPVVYAIGIGLAIGAAIFAAFAAQNQQYSYGQRQKNPYEEYREKPHPKAQT